MADLLRPSTMAEVKARCVEVLATAYADEDVQVAYGHPGGGLEKEAVFIVGAEFESTDWADIGAFNREERYAFDLYVNVERDGADQKEVTERAFELLAIANSALTANKNLIVGTAGYVLVRPRRLIEVGKDVAREAEIDAGIFVFAYL